VLRLCARAGLVDCGVVVVDGTKLTASASSDSNVDYDRIAREIIAEAIAPDESEDERHGDARGDELPPELHTEAGRREGWSASSRASSPRRRSMGRWRTSALSLTMSSILSRSAPTGGGRGCVRRTASSSASGGSQPGRSLARSRSGCASLRAGWRTSLPLNAAETVPMRNCVSIEGFTSSAGWVGRRSPTRHRRSRGAR
jgi:hypothetical protein